MLLWLAVLVIACLIGLTGYIVAALIAAGISLEVLR